MEKELKPFDKILVRNSIKGYWIPALYGFKSKDMKHHLTSAGWQDECIPYEGNEEYLGTNKDYVCPEIVESEDEKIRNQIKMFIISHSRNESNNKIDSWLAWLEKQGEQKDILEDATLDNNEDGLIADTIKAKCEQKPAWSEEDERMLSMCKEAVSIYFAPEDKWKVKDWLKSLKDRYTWKPNDEQMGLIKEIVL